MTEHSDRLERLQEQYLDWINKHDLFFSRDRPLIARDFAQIAEAELTRAVEDFAERV